MAFVMGGLWIAITGFKTLKNAGGQKKDKARAGIMIFGGVFFTIMTFSVFGANLYQINLWMVLVLMAQGVLVVLFYHLLKAPTPEGRKLMDQIEGFKEYLQRAEKEELDAKNAPEKTPELFELFLPYAIALGVENRWGGKFASILQQASENNDYQPTWYVGHGFTALTIGSFGSSFSQSFSGAFSSASMAPGSASGSGGGGSSGGGGGGGGGGGW